MHGSPETSVVYYSTQFFFLMKLPFEDGLETESPVLKKAKIWHLEPVGLSCILSAPPFPSPSLVWELEMSRGIFTKMT